MPRNKKHCYLRKGHILPFFFYLCLMKVKTSNLIQYITGKNQGYVFKRHGNATILQKAPKKPNTEFKVQLAKRNVILKFSALWKSEPIEVKKRFQKMADLIEMFDTFGDKKTISARGLYIKLNANYSIAKSGKVSPGDYVKSDLTPAEKKRTLSVKKQNFIKTKKTKNKLFYIFYLEKDKKKAEFEDKRKRPLHACVLVSNSSSLFLEDISETVKQLLKEKTKFRLYYRIMNDKGVRGKVNSIYIVNH